MRGQEQVEPVETEIRQVGAYYQTFQHSFEQICAGEDPWIPIGKLLHQFFGEYKEERQRLISDPLQLPEHMTLEQFQWAVFCAASVEHLCHKYELVCPVWALDPCYQLESPWYMGIGANLPHVQAQLRISTPDEFTRRNVFCGDRTFRNKYEYAGRRGRRSIA